MKVLVVYYSLDGNTEYIAKRVARTSGGDIQRLELQKEPPSNKLGRFMWCGWHAMLGAKPSLKELTRDPGEYDMVFVGSPVWAYTVAPPVASFLENTDLTDKKVALFATCNGNEGSTFEKMRSANNGGQVLGHCSFMKVLKETPMRKAAEAVKWTKHIVDTYDKEN
ncbi:MAG: flavodoxin [Thermoplasmatota archaeon]